MMIKDAWTSALLVAGLALAMTMPVEAQIGGLIKRKATEAVKGPDKKEEKEKTEEKPAGLAGGVTAATVDALVSGLKAEIALRKEFTAELAKYPTKEQYSRCQGEVATSPESQKLLAILDLPESATAEQRQEATTKFATEGAALLKRKCPFDPSEWNDSKKQKRLLEIEDEAARAFGARRSGKGDDQGSLGGPLEEYAEPLRPQTSDTDFYRVLKEWVPPLCEALKTVNVADARSKGLRIPGQGKGVFWVYTADEVKLIEPHCKTLLELLAQL